MGNISVNFGSSNAYTIKVEWTQGIQNIENNTTSVKFVCTLYSNRSSTSFTGRAKTDVLTVNGKKYEPKHGAFTVPGNGSVKLWEYTATIPHDDDGSFHEKSISCTVGIGVTFSSSGYIESVTASGAMSLDAIARASTMTISGAELGKTVTFAITAASTSFWHELTYQYGNERGTILRGPAAGQYTWTPPVSLAEQFPGSKRGDVTYTLTTRVNTDTVIGSNTYKASLSIPDSAAPKLLLGWADIGYYNHDTAAAGIAAFVQGYSKAQVTFDESKIALQYGASVKGYKISCNGVSASINAPGNVLQTNVLSGTTAKIMCTVEDSRGYTASETLDVTLLPYSKPVLTDISLYRSNADGVADSAGLHIYAKAKLTFSPLEGMNVCPLVGYYRAQAGSYGAGIPMESETAVFLTAAALNTQTYVAKIVATDSLGNSVSYEATIPTDSVAFHIRDGGKGAAFFKYAEKDGVLEVDGELELAKALGIASGGTGVKTVSELVQLVFDNSNGAASVRSYPGKAGIYRTIGENIFQNLSQPHSDYGVLAILRAYYAMHIYVDAYGNVFVGYSGDTFKEPVNWISLTQRGTCISRTMLWENPAPTSEFLPQTISGLGLENYDMYEVLYWYSTAYAYEQYTLARSGQSTILSICSETTGRTGGRVAYAENGNLRFGDAGYSLTSAQNTYCIPVAIYGIR